MLRPLQRPPLFTHVLQREQQLHEEVEHLRLLHEVAVLVAARNLLVQAAALRKLHHDCHVEAVGLWVGRLKRLLEGDNVGVLHAREKANLLKEEGAEGDNVGVLHAREKPNLLKEERVEGDNVGVLHAREKPNLLKEEGADGGVGRKRIGGGEGEKRKMQMHRRQPVGGGVRTGPDDSPILVDGTR